MNKEQKKNYIAEMTTQFENSKAVMVTHYQGLTMPQLDELRAKMREKGIIFKITKNRITKLALEKTKCKDLSNLFTGPTAVAFGEDAILSARILSKFAKENENLKLIGGIMDSEVLDQAAVQNVANLPTLDEARANIIGILNASASKLVSIFLARAEKMSILSQENSEKTT
ncbi:50S ribosomal protein L10 [Candidatus Pelagibacter sp.]|nr:50S ribosomal protein L10 [Candidatus Pelagibacter sp.]